MSKDRNLDLEVDQLVQNPWNTNVVNPENEEKLDRAIQEMGLFKPIVVRQVKDDSRYQIIGGEHRWESACRLGFDTVPVFNLGFIDDVMAKKISLADNARYGTDDSVSLAEILKDITEDGETLVEDYLPYTEGDIKSIFSSVDIALDELELDDLEDDEMATAPETSIPTKEKTHVIMRFKVSNTDSEKITELIEKIKKREGFTGSDDLTNIGDTVMHLLFGDSE